MDFEKNQIVTVRIEDMGTDGEGIGKIDGYTLFIKDALIGDLVEVKILKPKKNYAYARMEKVLEPSKDRIEPPCPYHRQCGGCQIQALSYDAQLRYKENKVRNNLIRIGKFDETLVDAVMESIVGMNQTTEKEAVHGDKHGIHHMSGLQREFELCGFRYRNKAQYPVGTDKEGDLVTGFYAGRTHCIIANTDCLLGVDVNRVLLEATLTYMKECHITAYDEVSGKGLVRHILIREGFRTGEIMVCLVVNGNKLPQGEKLVAGLQAAICGFSQTQWKLTSVSLNMNQENTNVILGNKTAVLWGQPYITDYIKDIAFQISPQSFFQVNPIQTEKLYSKALEYANLTGNEIVWDLYCGIGTISLFLAKQAKQVYGVEIIPEAIVDAKKNAEMNGIKNAEFFVGKAEEVLPNFYEQEVAAGRTATADVIVVDPPRKGCDEMCLNTMLKMQPERIVYVSCDSATLARDLKYLCEGGYKVRGVTPVDQFGQTVHVETIVGLQRRDM